MSNVDLINAALILVIFIYLSLAALIYFRGKDRKVSYSYITVISAVIFWTLGMILYRSASAENSLFLCRILYVFATFTASSFFIFSFIFPRGKLPSWWNIIIATLSNLFIIALVLLPNVIIKYVNIRIGQEKEIIWGPWYFIYVIYIAGFFSAGLLNLFRKYLKEKEAVVKIQLKYVYWGYFLGSNLAMATNLLMVWWGDFRLNWAGQILSAFMVAFTVYAIVAHRLMDIKLVARRSTVYLASLLTVFLPAIAVLYIIDNFFPDFLISASLILLVGAVSAFPSARNYFYRLANKYFFTSLYDSGQVISSLTDKLRSTLEPYKIYYFIADALKGAFHSKAVGLLTFNEKSDDYLVQYNDGFDLAGQKKFPNDRALQAKFAKQNKVMVVEEIKKEMVSDSAVTVEMLKGLGVEILAPLNVKDKTIGLIALGAKESRDMYNDEDLRVLETVGAQAAISIENALLYEETKNFTITLKQEVEKATAELRAANEELKKLDQAKSDFISIASHQLRTPLSSIKGFVSMMLEGTYGEAQGQLRQKLEDVYDSNERLIKLVDALLDLSHMEGGKMEFNFTKVNFSEMLASVVEELKVQAEKKKLNFEFAKPKENYFVRADEQKLRQVVLNLIDNAIKYTEKGEVKIWLGKAELSSGRTDGSVEFSVKDTGLGMTQEEIANLFQKFVRGPNAPRLHAEGAGIGLYVAKLLMEAHKGQVRAESAGENKGSTFFVKLPEYK
jgi:signal transduction histidine kinase